MSTLKRSREKAHTLVSPAIGATLQTFFDRSVLMMELFPTLGYPMQPTLK